MYETLFIVGIVLAALAVVTLGASIAMFVGFKIPKIWKDSKGNLEQRQIEEIRQKSSDAALRRSKVNVFEELEKKAKVKKPNTHSLNVGPTTGLAKNAEGGTSLLKKNAASGNSGFVIEKNIMFVSTNEVI